MTLSRLITLVVLIALVSLFYVHQQIELVKHSYIARSNQHRLNDLLDQNRILEYNVIALKAPLNLENRLSDHDINLVLPERRQVVRVAGLGIENDFLAEEKSQPLLYTLLRFFTFSREAQATPID